MKRHKGIDIGRIFFACLIPILHIPFLDNVLINIIRQYISRLGVPFFFAISGMFLSKSVENNGVNAALKRYLIRVGRILFIWLLIYSPLLIKGADSYQRLIQQILFKTPAFLWYLTSLLVAAIPFCLIKNRKGLYSLAFVLYAFGTLFGDTYKWLLGGLPWYENIFLTTRNGIFFGLPFLCVGELTWKAKRKSVSILIISWLALIAEITIVGAYVNKADDKSMYLLLPPFIFALVLFLRDWRPKIDGRYLGSISSAIYVMQYGIITAGTMALRKINLGETNAMWLVYIMVIAIPIIFFWLLRNTKIVKIIF